MVFILVSLFVVIERAIVPTLIAISESEVTCVINEALADAVKNHISRLLEGKTLLHFEIGQDGKLLYIRTNTADINQIQAEALEVLKEAMKNLEGFVLRVPLGQIMGSKILASLGPKIRVTLYPYGSVLTQVKDLYDVAGINQTRYNVFLNVNCAVRVVIPLISSKVEVSTDIPLTTILIPGQVPNTYLTLPQH